MTSGFKPRAVVSLALMAALSAPAPALAEARAAQFERLKAMPEPAMEIRCDDSGGSLSHKEFRNMRCPSAYEIPGEIPITPSVQMQSHPCPSVATTESVQCNALPGPEDQGKAVLPSTKKLKGPWVRSEGWNSLGPDPPRWLKVLWRTLSEALRPSSRAVARESQEGMHGCSITHAGSGN